MRESHTLHALVVVVLLVSAIVFSMTDGILGVSASAHDTIVAEQPLELSIGPHLFIDDYLIAGSENVQRRVERPLREFAGPLVTAKLGEQSGQPFVTVVYDTETTRFRMWFNAWRTAIEEAVTYSGPGMAYMESADGILWEAPAQRLDLEMTVSASVIDEGFGFAIPEERYKLAYSMAQKAPYRDSDWLKTRLAFSADGLNWTWFSEIDTLFPGYGSSSQQNKGDIINTYYDPIRGQYGLFYRDYGPYTWLNAEGESKTETIRRTGFMTSSDFKHWSQPRVIFSPDALDSGITEWYGGPAGVHRRGDLMIGMLKVLRDDVTVNGAPPEAFGMGYTVLTWTRDGVNWYRDRENEPFLVPDPFVGAWDHAYAWIDSVTAVGDELYLYYGGYKWGHKYHPQSERQIGMVRMERDRYAAQHAGTDIGTLTTPFVSLEGDWLSLNVSARQGWVEIEFLDGDGQNVSTCSRISFIDALDVVPDCTLSIEQLKGIPLQIRFTMQNASLFAFYLNEGMPTPTPTPTPLSTCHGLMQQAEDGHLFGAFEIANDIEASGSMYVHVPKGNADSFAFPDERQKVSYCVEIPDTGDYRVSGWVQGINSGSDSFYLRFDQQRAVPWHLPLHGFEPPVFAPGVYNLTAGRHQLDIYLRESGARLDRFQLVLLETPTETTTPTASPTATVALTPTPTPSPRPIILYLPIYSLR